MLRWRNSPWIVLATAGGVMYPLLVYFGLGTLPHAVFAVVGIGLLAVRVLGARGIADGGPWALAFALAATALAAWLVVSPGVAAKAYPVLVSLAVAAVFGWSLVSPPTVIERIARLLEGELPPEGVAYTRKITGLWVFVLLSNAGISAATGLWGSLETWTLWNGLLSYLLLGAVFAGELAFRKRVRKSTQCAQSGSLAC